jgi:hypothetical protein
MGIFSRILPAFFIIGIVLVNIAQAETSELLNSNFTELDFPNDGTVLDYAMSKGPSGWQIVSTVTGGAVYTDSIQTQAGSSYFAFHSLTDGFGANKLNQCLPIDGSKDLEIAYKAYATTPNANASGISVRINPNFYADYETCQTDSAADSTVNRLNGGRANSDVDYGLGNSDGNQWLDRTKVQQPALHYAAADMPAGAHYLRLSIRSRLREPAASLTPTPQVRLDDIRVSQANTANLVLNGSFEHIERFNGEYLSGNQGWQINRNGNIIARASVGTTPFALSGDRVFYFEDLSSNFGNSSLEQCVKLTGQDIRPSIAVNSPHPHPELNVRLNVDFYTDNQCGGAGNDTLRIREDFSLLQQPSVWRTLISAEKRTATQYAESGSVLYSIRIRDRSLGGQPSTTGRLIFLDAAGITPNLLPIANNLTVTLSTIGVSQITKVPLSMSQRYLAIRKVTRRLTSQPAQQAKAI